jgi:hypothetical protein
MLGIEQKFLNFFSLFVLVVTTPTFILQDDKNMVEALNKLQPYLYQSKVQVFSFSFTNLPHYLVKT